MAVLKHIAIKNADYSAAVCYLKYQHDERHLKPLLDENGSMMLRSEFHMNGVNCNPDTFDLECEMLNDQYRKNYRYDEVKSHHYIISFDPRDKDEHHLTGEKAQTLGLEFVKNHLPGHQALVCTHTDGHNGSGNIHVHIIINSLRKLDIEPQSYTTRSIDCKAGYKHHLTKDYLKYLQQELMNLCQRENLYQVDAPIDNDSYHHRHNFHAEADKEGFKSQHHQFTDLHGCHRRLHLHGQRTNINGSLAVDDTGSRINYRLSNVKDCHCNCERIADQIDCDPCLDKILEEHPCITIHHPNKPLRINLLCFPIFINKIIFQIAFIPSFFFRFHIALTRIQNLFASQLHTLPSDVI